MNEESGMIGGGQETVKQGRYSFSRGFVVGVFSSFIFQLSSFASSSAWTPPVFTRLDSLFVTAATGQPRFQAVRAAAEKALLADSATLPYLLRARLRGQTPRQQHYVERLFTVSSDSGRNPRPRALLAAALAAAPSDTIRIQLLSIGSWLGDSSFRAAALPWLKSPSEPVRRMAVRNLGTYPAPSNVPLLLDGLYSVRGLELQQRLWSLGAQKSVPNLKLTALLEDPYFFNRRKARDLLLKASDSSWARLDSIRMRQTQRVSRKEWWLLAQDARDGRAFLEAEMGKMTGEERIYFGLEPSK
jgi:hypothetical protein